MIRCVFILCDAGFAAGGPAVYRPFSRRYVSVFFIPFESSTLLPSVDQVFKRTILQVLIEPPSLNLVHHFVEFLAQDWLIHKAFTTAEPAKVPFSILKLRWNTVLPQRQILPQIRFEHTLGAIESTEISAHGGVFSGFGNPPQRFEFVRNNFMQPELLGHVDLRRQ